MSACRSPDEWLLFPTSTCSRQFQVNPATPHATRSSAGDAPPWVYALSAFSVLFYCHLDCLDGKQARRTKSSSPLGQLFDHGCDALSVNLLLANIACSLSLPCSWAHALGNFGVMFTWILAQVGKRGPNVAAISEQAMGARWDQLGWVIAPAQLTFKVGGVGPAPPRRRHQWAVYDSSSGLSRFSGKGVAAGSQGVEMLQGLRTMPHRPGESACLPHAPPCLPCPRRAHTSTAHMHAYQSFTTGLRKVRGKRDPWSVLKRHKELPCLQSVGPSPEWPQSACPCRPCSNGPLHMDQNVRALPSCSASAHS